MTLQMIAHRSVPTLMIAALACTAVGCAKRIPLTGPGAVVPAGSPQSGARLQAIYEQRHAERNDGDYVLGEGDVLAVRAFELDELSQRVRVDGEGAITLPLVNRVPASGRTVGQLQQDLTERLKEFMYAPQVTIFVEEYRSSQVAVLGAVQRPGLINQTGRGASIRDVLSAAGGLTADAGSRLFFIPAEQRQPADAQALAAGMPATGTSASTADQLADAIMIDTNEVDVEAQRAFFALPVRAGDVVMVPPAGNFIANGWVEKPGTYPVRSGLTLRGAIAIAGGLSFPAKTDRIRIFRPGQHGEITAQDVNFNDVSAQRAPDVFIHEGDVIEVATSPTKLVPYAAYKVIVDVVKVGAGIKFVP